jgi:hypothetical protein
MDLLYENRIFQKETNFDYQEWLESQKNKNKTTGKPNKPRKKKLNKLFKMDKSKIK